MSFPFLRSIRDALLGAPVARRSFEAASGGRRAAGWRGVTAPNSAINAARTPIMQRARHAAANNPTAAAAVEEWGSALIGSGFRPASTAADDGARIALQAAWARWSTESSFVATSQLVAKGLVRDGEAFARMTLTASGDLLLTPMAPEQVDSALNRELGGGARIIAGVEFGPSGEIVAYHVFPRPRDLPFVNALSPVRVPASEIVHLFRPDYPGQVRGCRG